MTRRASVPVGGENCRSAFSLMEVLVAVAVFSLLLVLLIQILSGIVRATSISQRQLEAREEAQAVLGAFEQDFGSAVTEFGVPVYGARQADGNARLAFLTRSRGPSAVTNTRFVSVDLRRQADGSFVRASAPVVWSDLALKSAAVQNPAPATISPLAANIVRFEAAAELMDGSIVPLDTDRAGSATFTDGSPLPDGFRSLGQSAGGTNAIRAITVSVAALDARSMEVLEQTNGLNALAGALGGGTGRTPLERWVEVLQNGGLSGFPRPVQESLQFAERTYPVP